MAGEPEGVRPIPVAAALRSRADALEVEHGQPGRSVVGDLGVGLASAYLGKVAYPIPHGSELSVGRPRPVGFGRESDRPVVTSEQKESASALRHSVPLHGHRSVRWLRISSVLQALKKRTERLRVRTNILDSRDILHKYDVGLALLDKAQELKKQRYPFVLVGPRTSGVLPGERLARGASTEQHGMRPFSVNELADGILLNLPNVTGFKSG
jgi:hypothetical protein